MSPRFSPNLEWLILAIIAATLATCCVKGSAMEDLQGKRGNVVQAEGINEESGRY